jgi:hypothetical protein
MATQDDTQTASANNTRDPNLTWGAELRVRALGRLGIDARAGLQGHKNSSTGTKEAKKEGSSDNASPDSKAFGTTQDK